MGLKQKFKNYFTVFRRLSTSQKLSVALLSLLLLSVPIGVFSVLTPKSLFYPRAKKPATPPGKPAVISWRTRTVSLESGGFYIKVDKVVYHDKNNTVRVHSDPGDSEYTTLEATWNENDREMRLNMYFASDGRDWWVTQVRTYNGQLRGDWIYYEGPFFKTPLGSSYSGNVILRTDKDSEYAGTVRFRGLELQAFIDQ